MSRLIQAQHPENDFIDIPTASDHLTTLCERTGLLSLTLAPSPVTQWILPARIRSPRHNDVVFVGSTSLQLRTFQSNGQFSDVTAKVNFSTRVLSAKVISARSERIPMIDRLTDQQWEEERFLIKGKQCADDQPPQILVLATASGELIYAYARDLSNGKGAKFVFARRALLEDVDISENHLRHMAIDTECKVMAVGSHTTCTFLTLKEVDDLQSGIDAWDPRRPQSFQPNWEQRMIQVDGHILHMVFLRPPKDEPEKIVLLLIVSNANVTRLLLYKWDTRESLEQIEPMSGVGPSLECEDQFPILLMPSQKYMSFVIVTEDNIVCYDRIRSGEFSRLPAELPPDEENKSKQLWSQWALPARHDMYRRQNEDIILVREDGKVAAFSRRYDHKGYSPSIVQYPGFTNLKVDSVVCLLPGPRDMGGDILVVGGSMNDGAVFHLPPRRQFEMLQVIQNFSPIHDMTLLDSKIVKQKDARTRRTFVTSGVPGRSCLNELRFGKEAQIGWIFPLPDSETVKRIWTFEHVPSRMLYVLMSHQEQTTYMALDLEIQQYVDMDLTFYPGLKVESQTLAADSVADTGVLITPGSIVAGFETQTPEILSIEDCVCADIDSEGGTFVIACRSGLEYHVQVGLVGRLQARPSILLSHSIHACNERPLCVALFELGDRDRQYVAVGYLDGGLEILSIGGEGELSSKFQLTSANSGVSVSTSITVLDHAGLFHALLLVGTRDGKLKLYRVTKEPSTNILDVQSERVYTIGPTQVTVINERDERKNNERSALVQCGPRLDQISSFRNDAGIDYKLINVWLTERDDLTFRQPNLTTAHRIKHLRSSQGDLSRNVLICATQKEILVGALLDQEQISPRRLGLSEEGARLVVYSKHLGKFIVANNPNQRPRSTDDGRSIPDTSSTSATLRVVSVDGNTSSDDSEAETCALIGAVGDEIKVLLPWEPTDGKLHFDLIMIGLNSEAESRLGYVSSRKLASSPASALFKPVMKFGKKRIHAVCAMDKSSLVISVGRELVVVRLDVVSKKWSEDGTRFELPSCALSLTARGSIIYAATKLHSTLILNWRKTVQKFEKIHADRVARNTRTITPFGKSADHVLVTTASDRGSAVLGYAIGKNSVNSSSPLFEVEIPHSIERIAPVPTSWSSQSHYAFQGVSFDGTVLIFETLSYDEWKLLHFLEELAQPHPAKSGRKPMALLTQKMARNFFRNKQHEKSAFFNPKKMHIHGDVIKGLVDQGTEHLQQLLCNPVKHEDEMNVDEDVAIGIAKLQSLATPVIGNSEHVAAAVIAWARKLLYSTIF